MENEPKSEIDYVAVLADLLARRESLDKAIEAVRPLAGQSAPRANLALNGIEIRSDTFFGLSVPEAIRKLMAMKRKPLTPAEIAEDLEKGGLTHSSASFVNTVGSVLHRLAKGDSGIILVKRGQYGLAEWYPGHKRRVGKKNGEPEEREDDGDTGDKK